MIRDLKIKKKVKVKPNISDKKKVRNSNKNITNDHRDTKWKNKIKTHGGNYRNQLRINREKVKECYRQTGSIELGRYRHNRNYINYDYIVNKAAAKWEPRDRALAVEIIHSIQNKANSLILECIIEAAKEDQAPAKNNNTSDKLSMLKIKKNKQGRKINVRIKNSR